MGSVLSTEQQKPRRDRGKLKGRMEQAPQELSNAARQQQPPAPSSLVPQRGMLSHVPAVPDGVPNLSSSSNLKRPQNPEE